MSIPLSDTSDATPHTNHVLPGPSDRSSPIQLDNLSSTRPSTPSSQLGREESSPLDHQTPVHESVHSSHEKSSLLPPSERRVRRWTPFPARFWVVCLLIGFNVLLVAVLVVLWVLSRLWHGLITIDLKQPNALTPWHLVSTAIASIDALGFGAIVTASLFCQPYILLQREGGVNAAEALTIDYSASLPIIAIRAIRRRHWAVVCFAITGLLCLTFSSLAASLFSPQDVWVEKSTPFNFSKTIGRSDNVNATDSFIRAILLAAAQGTYGEEVSLPPLTNQAWTLGPVDDSTHPPSLGSNSASPLNVTVPGWYGIFSDPACRFGQLVNSSVKGLNLSLTFADENGECLFEPTPFPSYYPFGFVNAVVTCGSPNQTTAQGGSLVFGRLTPLRLAQNDTTAISVIYCRPIAVAMSVDATWDSQTRSLLLVDNVQPLSGEQQQLYDPNNFSGTSLLGHAWNGFVIDPDINTNVPPLLVDFLNQWINLTISVYVGGSWLNKSTTLINGTVVDDPQAYSDETRHYYLSSLTNFYQTYLTLLAAGSYFMDSQTKVQSAFISGFQTRLFISTPACWALITVLLLSTALTLLANLLQPRIALPVGTSPHLLITVIKLGRSPDIANLCDLNELDVGELRRVLGNLDIRLEEGELRVLKRSLED